MIKEKKIGATVEQLNDWYKDAVAYQTGLGLTTSIPQCVKFYEGNQWEAPTKATKYFPRPVVNIVEMNCNNKKSQVLSSPVKIVYKSEDNAANVEKFNRFAEYQQARLRQKELDNKAILDGVVKGSYCYYYYWDDSIVGLDGLVEGDIAVQLVDPLNVLFANPNEKDEQKQDWIMLISRESVDRVKELADEGVDQTQITDDDNQSYYNEIESDTEKYVTVMTRFFRHEGEVYFERATSAVVFNEARPFTPNVEFYKNAIEGKKASKTKKEESNKYIKDNKKATLYPIVFSSWKDRDKSIYGRGEVETIIPNQKAINWTLGLQILMAQNEGMSPVVVTPDALKGQRVTNEPGQVLTDYSKSGNGIRFPNKPGMTAASVSLVDKIADLTRVATGSSEVMNGEIISSGMSGAAIAQLQAQALKPIEDLQKGFWRTKEKIGEVLEQFFRFFFKGKKFQYTDEKQEKIIVDEFNSDEYKEVHFDVVAEAVAGTVMSDVADINILDGLFSKGAISLRTYISCYPDNAIANRQKLLEKIDEEEQSVIIQLQNQMKEVQAQLQQASVTLEEQSKIIEDAKGIVNENRELKARLLALQNEYRTKMEQANQILYGLASKTKEYYDDAKNMASEVAQKRGLTTGQPINQVNPSI